MSVRPSVPGFTIVELCVTLLVGTIILGATYAVMVSQQRFFARQTQVQDHQEGLRAAAAILGAELRQASAVGGDFLAIAPDSFVLRTPVGFGVVCAVNLPKSRLAIRWMAGRRWETSDSTLLFVDHEPGAADDEWQARKIVSQESPTGDACAYGDRADARVVLDAVGDGVRVGAQLRPFRWYVYRLYAQDGRLWLGRRAFSDAGFTRLVGPLVGPGSSLELSYLDADASPTLDPERVASVGFSVRTVSFGRAPARVGARSAYARDTITARTFLRNN